MARIFTLHLIVFIALMLACSSTTTPNQDQGSQVNTSESVQEQVSQSPTLIPEPATPTQQPTATTVPTAVSNRVPISTQVAIQVATQVAIQVATQVAEQTSIPVVTAMPTQAPLQPTDTPLISTPYLDCTGLPC